MLSDCEPILVILPLSERVDEAKVAAQLQTRRKLLRLATAEEGAPRPVAVPRDRAVRQRARDVCLGTPPQA